MPFLDSFCKTGGHVVNFVNISIKKDKKKKLPVKKTVDGVGHVLTRRGGKKEVIKVIKINKN